MDFTRLWTRTRTGAWDTRYERRYTVNQYFTRTKPRKFTMRSHSHGLRASLARSDHPQPRVAHNTNARPRKFYRVYTVDLQPLSRIADAHRTDFHIAPHRQAWDQGSGIQHEFHYRSSILDKELNGLKMAICTSG